MISHLFIFILLTIRATHGADLSPIVALSGGKVQGSLRVDRNGFPFYSFQGMPYAEVPVGELRFRSPKPPRPWTGILNATHEGNMCPQIVFDKYLGDENCLFINVYTPAANFNHDKLPVLFWIHGGTFVEGSGNTDVHGPENFMPENIILVTVNYRLATLGFLKTTDTNLRIPGNAGLKDLVLALKWTQQNIKSFGGDPNLVTVAGNSAGGVAAHLINLSKSTRGLYHRVIAQSGNALMSFARALNPTTPVRLAHVLCDGCNVTETEAVRLLMDTDPKAILEAQYKLGNPNFSDNQAEIGPVIEDPQNNEDIFLDRPPLDVLKRSEFESVPFLAGYTDMEGMFIILYGDHNIPVWTNATLMQNYLPKDLGLTRDSPESLAAAKEVAAFYTAEHVDWKYTELQRAFLLITDNTFLVPTHNCVRLVARKSTKPVYFYRFSLDTDLNMFKRQTNVTSLFPGAAHTDEKGYLFNYTGAPKIAPHTAQDLHIRRMTRLWSNFVKNGDPNDPETYYESRRQSRVIADSHLIDVNWMPVSADVTIYDSINYLAIDTRLEPRVGRPDNDRMDFWNNLYLKNNASIWKDEVKLIVKVKSHAQTLRVSCRLSLFVVIVLFMINKNLF